MNGPLLVEKSKTRLVIRSGPMRLGTMTFPHHNRHALRCWRQLCQGARADGKIRRIEMQYLYFHFLELLFRFIYIIATDVINEGAKRLKLI